MKTARDIMSKAIVSIQPDSSVQDAMEMILECGVSGLPVIEDGQLVGIISETDLCMLGAGSQQSTLSVRDTMTRVVSTVAIDTPIEKISEMLMSKNIRRVPVTDGDQVVGIVSRRDIVRAMTATTSEDSSAYVT